MDCLCQSGKMYDDCCGAYHSGSREALTAELLMRARYCAFAKGDIAYIEKTHDPEDRENLDLDAVRDWSQSAKWLGFELLNVIDGTENDDQGSVEFKAYYKLNDIKQTHHEQASFIKVDDKWYFKDAEILREQVVRTSPKVGRNDLCQCGSGKKYKKCCITK